MIQPMTRLKCADNTGARQILCVRVMDKANTKTRRCG